MIVPDASQRAVLVVGSHGRFELPHVRGRPGAAGVIEALRHVYSLDAPYLRAAQILRDEAGQPVAGLHELDAPPPGWEPTPGTAWLELESTDPTTLAPSQFISAVERWWAEQRGAPVPERRPPWARPGWLAEASSWICDTCVANGFAPSGPVELVAQWPLSSVLRLETEGGRVYMKAVFSIFGHEPTVTEVLSAQHPTLVPEVVAVDAPLGWMLMHELHGTELGDADVSRWGDGLRAAASIHRAWVGRTTELFTLGAHDRTLETLADDMRTAFESIELPAEARARLERVAPELERLCEELATCAVPETLIHGDLHPWNVMVEGDELRIFDWSDACVAHPMFDLPTFLTRTEDESARVSMCEAYFAEWGELASLRELQSAFALARPLGHLHQAVSYVRINDALEPDDRWIFAGAPEEWLEGAIGLVEAMR